MPVPPRSSFRRRPRSRSEKVLAGTIAAVGVGVAFCLLWRPAPPPPPAPPVARAPSPPLPPPPPPPAPAEPRAEVLTSATLRAKPAVMAGSEVAVTWRGPENPDDFVTLVPAGASDASAGPSVPVRTGARLDFTAPTEPGEYEFRYLAGRSKRILGSTPLTVLPLTAQIAAPEQAVLGTKISVSWTGPNRPGDYLTIVAPEVSAGVAGEVLPATQNSPAEIKVPFDPGVAEIRYMSPDRSILGRKAILVTIPVTTLSAPSEVAAGATFEVRWRGPDSPGDTIVLVPRGAPESTAGISKPTADGSVLTMRAPPHAGEMELRYIAGAKPRVFARRPLIVLAEKS